MNIPYFHLKFEEHNKYIDYGQNNIAVSNYGCECAEGKSSKYSAYFNGDSGKYIRCFTKQFTPATGITWSMWVMKNAHSVSSYPIFVSFGLPYLACDGSSSGFRLSYRFGGNQKNIVGTTIPALHTWYYLTATFSSSGIKLYINGVLETSTTDVSDIFDSAYFDLGRHLSENTYRIWGRIDDVRIFEKELSLSEINFLYNPQSDPVKMSFKDNGDVVCYGIKEDIEWTLLDNFQSANQDGGIKRFETSIAGNNITSAASLSSAGWTQYLTTFDHTDYTRVKGYLQMFYSGSPIGYIYKNLPSGYNKIKIYWGNWYPGTATLKIGGTVVQTLAANVGSAVYVGDYTGTPEIRFEENGIFWVGQIWVGKTKPLSASITNTFVQKHTFVCAGLSHNLHDYSGWTTGSGSVGNFINNGNDSESYRGIMADPWDQYAMVWECRAAGDSGADGGWTHNAVSIDPTKTYRYSVWVKKNSSTAGYGTFYHGIYGIGTTNGVYGRVDGGLNTNPYFYYSESGLTANAWYLVVGHMWPAGSGTGTNYPNSGIWTPNGTKAISITQDYVWHPTSSSARCRNYLYYSSQSSARQWLVYPMFELCDGTEAPMQDLLSGRAYVNSGRVPGTIYNLGAAKQQVNDNKLFIKGKIILK